MEFFKPTHGKVVLSIVFTILLIIFALPVKPNAYCMGGGECPPMKSLSFVPISALGLFGLTIHYYAFSFTGFILELMISYFVASFIIFLKNKHTRNA